MTITIEESIAANRKAHLVRLKQLAIHKLRVNIKSLASEAKHIRRETSLVKDHRNKAALHYHRMTRIKPEARMAHLALAYIKGVPYRKVEQKTHVQLAARPIVQKFNRFLPEELRVTDCDVAKWLLGKD